MTLPSLFPEPPVPLEIAGLRFWVRPHTSDAKALAEVVVRRAYERKDFPLQASQWLDLGANIGAFTVLAASLGAYVTAVEPDPDSADLLRRNVAENGYASRVTIVQAAVVPDDAPAEATLHVNSARGNFWRNSLLKPWRGGSSVRVPTVPFSLLLRDAPTADVKMDIEGSEVALLSGEWQPLPEGRLVFEWSFDIVPALAPFFTAIRRCEAMYDHVVYGKFRHEGLTDWPAAWFPPTRMVWCW